MPVARTIGIVRAVDILKACNEATSQIARNRSQFNSKRELAMADGFFSVSEEEVPRLMVHHFNLIVAKWLATDVKAEEIGQRCSKVHQ